ncbi:MAG: hypothetical protein AAFQ64_20885 [Pseudomonadota bacterium]
MAALVWGGTALVILGLIGILYSLYRVRAARQAGLNDDALRAQLSKILPINIGGLFGAMLGLIIVIVGVILS